MKENRTIGKKTCAEGLLENKIGNLEQGERKRYHKPGINAEVLFDTFSMNCKFNTEMGCSHPVPFPGINS